jgi:hypothetical protein
MMGLKGTSRVFTVLVLFGLALVLVLCVMLLSTQPSAA